MSNMFKRFNRPSDRSISNPTLMETTLDEKSIEGLKNLNDGELSLSANPAFGRRRKEDVLKDLPDIPFKNSQTRQPHSARPYSLSSSLYSQPSPDRRNKQPRLSIPRASSVYPDDVSPPDSPRTVEGGHSKKSSPNISPITDVGSNSFSITRPYVSGIPLPRGQPNMSGVAAVSGWREKVGRVVSSPAEDKKLTRWDDLSGEPTDSEKGKPAQAVPGTIDFEQLSKDKTGSGGYENAARSGGGAVGDGSKASFSERLRRTAMKEEAPIVREEWRGASGRSPIVMPVTGNPRPEGRTVTPTHIRGSLKHTVGLRPRPVPGRTSPSADRSLLNDAPKAKPIREIEEPVEDPTILPIVPLKVAKNRLSLQSSNNSPIEARSSPAPIPNPDKATVNDKELTPPPTLLPSAIPFEETEAQIIAATQNLIISNEPGSRFSATTIATTIPGSQPGTPRRSLEEPPPLPTPPLPITSILNRKRPVPAMGTATITNPTPPSRKPTPSEAISDRSKSLPQSPPEANATDRVSLLQAKIDSLKRREANLKTVIHELTHVVQPSSIAYDLASRQEIKKTVEGLNAELATVAQELHETGLKLHRAMKRRDENSMFEPTGLWVRRVTE